MTTTEPSLSAGPSEAPGPGQRRMPRTGPWLPTWDLITTKNLEIRKRRGLMITMVVLIIVPTVLFYGLRLLFHAVDPHGYGLAGSPQFFSQSTNLIDEFGFIAAAALGAAAGTTDLSDGMFRHLVITGRSRLALYLARIPAGLAITVPLVALAFLMNCLVTSYESPPNPTTASFYGVTAPNNLDQAGLQTFLLPHPQQEINGFLPGVPGGPGITPTVAQVRSAIDKNIASYYSDYTAAEISGSTPGGQRDGQDRAVARARRRDRVPGRPRLRLAHRPAHDHGHRADRARDHRDPAAGPYAAPLLHRRPAAHHRRRDGPVAPGRAGRRVRPGPGRGGGILFGGRGAIGFPPMPTWAMISVIAGWIVGWSGLGAWRMMTRDA